MNLLNESKFKTIQLYPSNVFELKWKSESKEMTQDDYKTEMQDYIKLLKEFNPKLTLNDTTQLSFVINVELQDWTTENVTLQAVDLDIQLTAFVMSEDIIRESSESQKLKLLT